MDGFVCVRELAGTRRAVTAAALLAADALLCSCLCSAKRLVARKAEK